MRKTLAKPPKRPTKRHFGISLDESIGFLICDAARFVKRALYPRIAKYGVRGGSWFLLRVLWLEEGLTQRDLSYRLGLMEPSVLEMVRAMERDGLVYRLRDELDRRRLLIHLTERGRQLEKILLPIAREVNEQMLQRMPLTSEERLKRELKMIREFLALDADASRPPSTPSSRAKLRPKSSQQKSSRPKSQPVTTKSAERAVRQKKRGNLTERALST